MRFTLPYNFYRCMGIAGLFLLGYIVVIGVFGRIDISGLLPIKLATSIQTHWPDLPFFTVEKQSVDGGKGQEIYYTVPTRQLTPKEVAQIGRPVPVTKAAEKK
jgi:hypothetical protein